LAHLFLRRAVGLTGAAGLAPGDRKGKAGYGQYRIKAAIEQTKRHIRYFPLAKLLLYINPAAEMRLTGYSFSRDAGVLP
jgi:hypothetical protein